MRCVAVLMRLVFLRYHLPEKFGGQNGTNLAMAMIREHLAAKGLGLHNDLQNESSIVGNFPTVLMIDQHGTDAQREEWIPRMLAGEARIGFGLTEPEHGSDATWMETTAERDGDEWLINGKKMWNSGLHRATRDFIFARTSGEAGDDRGITCFIVPTDSPGFRDRRVHVDLQHANRPRAGGPQRRQGWRRLHPRR